MLNQKKMLVVSHAPFVHIGSSIPEKTYNMIFVALIATLPGLIRYGVPALGVVSLAVSSAVIWEYLMNMATKQPVSVGDGNAVLIGLLFAMMLPATAPWWLVVVGTCVAIVIGKCIFGGMGANPFNPTLIGISILMVSWKDYFDFDAALANYTFDFFPSYPIVALKNAGPDAVSSLSACELLMGNQIGGIGATCGILLILGGIYLIIRNFIRWEIPVAFLAGIILSVALFNRLYPGEYGGITVHLFSGYTLIGAFYLATDDSSSPVYFKPMLIYGAGCGIMTVLIRNLGIYADGVVLAILFMNIVNPIVDKIRPKAIGKVA